MFPETTFVEFGKLLTKLMSMHVSVAHKIVVRRVRASYVVNPKRARITSPPICRDGSALEAWLELKV